MKNAYSLLCCLLLILFIQNVNARVWYVKADAVGANTGLNWTDAFRDLQDGLRAAKAGDEIWVAQGVYVPTKTGDRGISFVLKSGLSLYGGFEGWENHKSQRKGGGQEFATILSGFINESTHSYHVVFGRNVVDVLMDRITITDGKANGPRKSSADDGGGLYLEAHGFNKICQVKIQNCFFERNEGKDDGGGFYIDIWNEGRAKMEFTNCAFSRNTAGEGGGAAVLCRSGEFDFHAEGCSFQGNYAIREDGIHDYGGGLYFYADKGLNNKASLKQCLFDANNSSSKGGGLGFFNGVFATTTVEIMHCSFTKNVAEFEGGAILFHTENRPVNSGKLFCKFQDCLFSNNTAFGFGGAVFQLARFEAASAIHFEKCHFSINKAISKNRQSSSGKTYLADGQNAYIEGHYFDLISRIHNFQHPTSGGGAIASYSEYQTSSTTDLLVENCTFQDNETDQKGGVLFSQNTEADSSTIYFFNCKFEGNKGPEGRLAYLDASTKKVEFVECQGLESKKESNFAGNLSNITIKIQSDDAEDDWQSNKSKIRQDGKGFRIFVPEKQE